MTYTVTILYAGKGAAFLETTSARGALDFYKEPSNHWPISATIHKDGKEITPDQLAQLAVYEESEQSPL